MALRLTNGVDDLASRGVSVPHQVGIVSPVLQEPAKHRGVMRGVGTGKVDVRRSHHLEGAGGVGPGVRANSLQRVVQELESIGRNPCDQRGSVIEMTVESGPRDADFSPDPSKRESVHAFRRDDLDSGRKERAFEVAVVILPFRRR